MTDVAVTLLGPDQTLDAREAVRCKRRDADSEAIRGAGPRAATLRIRGR